jgi:hypothetical protein
MCIRCYNAKTHNNANLAAAAAATTSTAGIGAAQILLLAPSCETFSPLLVLVCVLFRG